MDKKILITGGAGYIGSHTAIELLEAGYEPVILDNFANSEKSVLSGLAAILGKEPILHEGDCANEALLDQVFKVEKNIVGAIHFAAYKAVGESVENPLKYYENNIGSLLALLRVMEKHKTPYFVFSSSCTVYGQPDKLPVTETTPKKPAESPYGSTKKICEEIIEDYARSDVGLKSVSLRYFNPIGAHPSSHIGELPIGIPSNLVPFITQTAAGIRKQLTVFGDNYDTPDGTCIRDYIHVVDLAKAHVKALNYLENQKSSPFYDVFNVGTGNGNTVLEVVKTFEEVSGEKLNYVIGPRRSGDIEKVYANVDKANKLLNWKTALTLKDSLRDAWNWQKNLQLKK